jgi:hypothetical protein
MSREDAESGSAPNEYLKVPELAKMVRRNRKTVYGWIATGEIGEADGLFVVQGCFLIHWPTFRAKQFKPAKNSDRKIACAWPTAQTWSDIKYFTAHSHTATIQA